MNSKASELSPDSGGELVIEPVLPRISTPSSSEFYISRKWDNCVESLAVNSFLGTTTAFATSLVLFRRSHARVAMTAAGFGLGVGLAWTKCCEIMEVKTQDVPFKSR